MKIKNFLPIFLFCLGSYLFAQSTASSQSVAQDPALLIGSTLQDLLGRYGVPKQVYAVRGVAAWQDDVVFVYDSGEFYIFGNRVWQLKLRSAYNVKDGDSKAAVNRTMGEGRNFETYTLYQLPSKVWPIILRVNWDAAGRAAGIYIYRSDF
jgi:hypothetical protein